VAHERDIVIKMQATALCGSDLHIYRGLEPTEPGPIMGHEFVGHVIEAGAGVQTLSVGDKIVCPFTVSWYVGQHYIAQNRTVAHRDYTQRPVLVLPPG